MFFIFSKILSFLLTPLCWAFVLVAWSFFSKKHAKKLRIVSIIVLYLFSNSFLLNEVNRLWEVPVVKDDELKPMHTGVVLGGFSTYDTTTQRISFRYAADRMMQSLRLLGTEKIQTLVVSGGSGYLLKPELKEGIFVGKYLDEIRVPKDRILLETASRNTQENAAYTAALLQEKHLDKQSIILITSAFHMRRAKACFEKQGFRVIAYPTDPFASDRSFSPESWLVPDAYVLKHWDVLIHEWIGYISYWVMGYL